MNFYKYLAEFVGTFTLVMVNLVTGNPIMIGAALTLIILLTSSISGGHINPAVSFAMVSLKQMETELLIPYIASQILGGLTAVEIYHRYKKYFAY
jgi:aquaporin Z